MNKKGAELSITVIVVIILALLVLIVVALIFLGGSTGLTQRLKNVFLPQQAIAVDLARQTCEQWCSFAEGMTPENAGKSSYCEDHQERVDVNRDGNPDEDSAGKLIWYWCAQDNHNPDVDVGDRNEGDLGVSCDISCI